MSSEEIETDLPVAALFVENTEEPYCSDIYFSEEGFNSDNTHDLQYFKDSDVHNVVECTRRSDAEAAIAKERSRKYDQGFFEGRQSREKEILDKIQEMFTAWRKRADRLENQENYSGDKELELNKGKAVKNALKELEEEVDQS